MQKINENLKKFFDSRVSIKVLHIVGIALATMLVFSAGVAVGFHKANFDRTWGEHYMQNFGMFGHSKFGLNDLDESPNAHGAVGKIIKIQLPTIIVQDKDNTEKVILLAIDTKIEKMRVALNSTDLKLDDFVVIIGTPDEQGQIEAKFIRVISNPDLLTPTQTNANTIK